MRIPLRVVTLIMCFSVASCARSSADDTTVESSITVFAAASLTDTITTLADSFQSDTGIPVKCSFASSSTLARQIQAGAPVDIFLSANVEWMNVVERDGLIDRNSRIDLLGNTLVIIAPQNDTFAFDPQRDAKFEDAFEGRIAIGDPDHVPAGIYAKQALTSLGSWDVFADRIVFAGDVRGVLMFVERGEVAAGIVYATDARMSDRVSVVAELPTNLHDSIVYPAALTDGASQSAKQFFNYLRSDDAAVVFRDAGFVIRSSSP